MVAIRKVRSTSPVSYCSTTIWRAYWRRSQRPESRRSAPIPNGDGPGCLIDDFRRAGIYAAKIISGEKPGDLPIEQASKFILVFNLKTAKSLGIPAPDRLLTVADEVIE